MKGANGARQHLLPKRTFVYSSRRRKSTTLLDDGINPRFVYLSPVHFDELDPMQMLHNGRFPAHIERAVCGWYAAGGGRWERNTADNPDQFHVVRDLHIEYLNPGIRIEGYHHRCR
jgi:hypothetical protein